MRRLPLALCILASLAAAGLGAQDANGAGTGVPGAAPLRQVRVLVALARGDFEREAWLRGLALALAREPGVSGVLRARDADSYFDEANRQDCALVLEIETAAASASTRVEWRYLDALSREVVTEGAYEAPEPTERDLSGFFWDEVVAALPDAVSRVRFTVFTLTGKPGSKVSGFSPKPVVIPESGELEIVADAPSTYRWRATVPDSYPAGGVFAFFGTEGTVLALPDETLPRWSFDAGLLMGQFPDLRADWRFLSDWAFAGFELVSYSPGLFLPRDVPPEDRPSLFIFLPLIQPGIRVGARLAPADAAFRPYVSTGAFTRFVFPEFRLFMLDPVAPFGLSPAVGVEYGTSRKLGVWAEVAMHWYFGPNGYLIAASGPGNVFFVRDHTAIEIPHVRFGVRFAP
ncbi:MAG: hypothetical protein JXA15_10735 [Spirochaetales bacterium]|nr:hypothetical protein [Spirochaetales bacterium]